MATAGTPTTMAGFHKVVYADGVKPLLPENLPLMSRLEFKKGEKLLGKYFSMPLEASFENGFTFGGTAGNDFTLNSAVSMETQEAQVYGSEIVLKVRLSKAAARRAMASQAAYARATDTKMKSAAKSFGALMETLCLYGQSTRGVGSISGTPATSGSNKVITISDPTWAAGIWLGRKGMSLDAYSTGGSQINSNAALVVKSVDLANKKVTVSGNATDLGNLADTHVLVFRGAYSNAFAGLDTIFSPGSTLWGITVADAPDIMSGSSVAVSGPITLQHVIDAASVAADRGADGRVLCILPTKAFGVLNGNEAALRRYDGSYSRKKSVTGSESLEVVSGPLSIEIVGSSQCKEGEGFVAPAKEMYFVGASEITDRDPVSGEVTWNTLETVAASELDMSCDQALFVERPAAVVKLMGISY